MFNICYISNPTLTQQPSLPYSSDLTLVLPLIWICVVLGVTMIWFLRQLYTVHSCPPTLVFVFNWIGLAPFHNVLCIAIFCQSLYMSCFSSVRLAFKGFWRHKSTDCLARTLGWITEAMWGIEDELPLDLSRSAMRIYLWIFKRLESSKSDVRRPYEENLPSWCKKRGTARPLWGPKEVFLPSKWIYSQF